jgi:hypothetical protein
LVACAKSDPADRAAAGANLAGSAALRYGGGAIFRFRFSM